MFFHQKALQFEASPDKPDPLYAKKLQEILGGQWGEISVMMTYLLQGWSCRMPGKYKDMLLDIGTEEIAHVEMLSTLIAKLLEGAPPHVQEKAMQSNPGLAAVYGGMNPQHAIVGGLGPKAADSVGVPWNGNYAVSSGNLLADFRYNVTAESQGRLQACRLYAMTDDPGVRKTLSFLIARDRMHQNQWLAAIQELQDDGLEETPVPSAYDDEEVMEHGYTFWSVSDDNASQEGRWAQGQSIDGHGEFSYLAEPEPLASRPTPPAPAPELFTTGTPAKGVVKTVKDKLT